MSSTNKTTNYNLSQFLGSDKPAWLVDYNSDMSAIDTQMKANADAAASAQSTANGADSKADTNAGAISTLNTQINGASGIAADVSTLQGNVNTINSLIGNGEPTTTDKTLIGAINELNAKTLITGYVVEGTHIISAPHDGVKTYKELAAFLKTGVETLLNNHEALMIGNIQISGVGTIPNANMAYVVKSTNVSSQNVRGSLSVLSSDKDYQFAISIPFDDPSNTSYRQSTFDGTTRAFSDLSNTVADHDLSLMIVALDPNEFT